ncbi:MAG: cytochrome c oxidase subunit II [Acidimicrobiia bacterium]|nr:cytochrome c oxidase subunit II [Acidimicrobiia bacterium]
MARNRLYRLLALAALGLLLGACSVIGIPDSPLNSLDPKGPFAERIDNLFWPVFWIAVAMFVLVEGVILVAAIGFRDRKGRKEPRQIHGNTKLEILWTVIPAAILASIAVPTVRGVFELTECGEGAYPVEIIGHQWWFEYRYPLEGIETANVLVIPADREVCASMTSEDVLHNYWVPALNGKRYLVPGQTTILRLQADDPGIFWGQCAEFCGLSHSLMRAQVRAVTETKFSEWITAQQQPAAKPADGTAAAAGLDAFLNRGCTQCHNIDAINEIEQAAFNGPDLTHFMDRGVLAGAYKEYSTENLKIWLANPPKEKPGSFMPNLGLTQQEIDDLAAFLETLH